MKTGGSNYITINGSMENPVIGTYHLFPEKVADDLREMFEHGQRKITLLLWFAPVNFPAAHDHLWHHVCDSYGGALCQQHQDNIVALLSLIERTGFKSVHFRFGPQGKAMDREWLDAQGQEEWRVDQVNENWNFIRSVSDLVRASRGSLNVVFDLGVEHANERLNESGIHDRYCRRIWRLFTELNGTADSCAFSILHGGDGLRRMVNAFKTAKLPLPSCYCFDTYGFEYQTLTGAAPVLQTAGEFSKPVFIQETYYNDAASYADIKRAVAETGLNFQGIFQWREVRDTTSADDFIDVFPKRFDNYLVEV